MKNVTSREDDAVDLSVVIPCFNEEEGITRTVERVKAYIASSFPEYIFEILLVNDGSTDQTAVCIESLKASHPQVMTAHFEYNKGRGAAIKTGLTCSRGRVVIVLDADLTYDERHIGEILARFQANRHLDVVIISPYSRGGIVRGVPFQRLFVSRIANFILSGFFSNKISTVTCVVRGYRGSLVRSLPLFEEGKELHLEILRKLALCGATMEELPGRLIWTSTKAVPRRKNNLKLIGAAKRHLLYAVLAKPTRLIGFLTLTLFFVGAYEFFTVFKAFLSNFDNSQPDLVKNLWQALAITFAGSPHSVVIAVTALVLFAQAASFLALFTLMKLQHEESMRHQLAVLSELTQRKQI